MSNIKPQSNDLLTLQKFILDPLSSIIKLAVLGKKNIGCKISIKNNQIYIQENGIFQGIARYYHGVTKNDIHYLSIPIELACKRYLTHEKIKEIPNIKTIFKCSQEGLNNLMKTYNIYPIIVHCLKYYHTIIDNYLHLISCEVTKEPINKEPINKEPINKEPINKEPIIYKKIDDLKHMNLDETTDTKYINKTHTKFKNKEKNSENLNEILNYEININIPSTDINNNLLVENQNEHLTDKINDNESDKYTLHVKSSEISDNELLLLSYTDNLLNNFDLIWDKSKIEIIINMIDYLDIEKSASDYAAYIETFMIPIDKKILKIIYQE
jgi:hypothetical protein